MQTHYLISNSKQGCWGRGVTIEAAIANSGHTYQGDHVHVYLCDPDAQALPSGVPNGRFHVFIGSGFVTRQLDKVDMFLGGPTARVNSADTLAMHQIQTLLDGDEWEFDMLDDIAAILRQNGYPVHSPEDT